jgi:hypothetical protein
VSRFLVLMTEPDHFERWEHGDDAYRERAFAHYRAFAQAVRERGSIVFGDALERPEDARTVRAGEVVAGPYAETVEQLGGLYVIDVADHDTAVEMARLLPPEYTIEVRPTLEVEV